MTKLLTTTAVILAIGAIAPAQAKTSMDGLSASTPTMNDLTMNGGDTNGAAIENEGGFATALKRRGR